MVGFNDSSYAHDEPIEEIVDLHARLGADVQRLGIPWRFVEPSPGRLDWSISDRAHDEALLHGIKTVALVASAPRWAAPASTNPACRGTGDVTCQQPPARQHLPAFQRFVRELVQRYPGVVAVEVYNEPNLGAYNWQPQADPEYYTEVLRAAHTAVRAVRPSVAVISGGITSLPREPVAGAMDPQDFLRRMYAAGARGAMDGIGIHPYPGGQAPSAAMTLVQQVRALRNAAGDRKTPLWVTETGYTTTGPTAVSEQRQAELVPQVVKLLAAEADIESVIVHGFRDRDYPGYADRFGVAYKDLRFKPVAEPLRRAFLDVRSKVLRSQAASARHKARKKQNAATRKEDRRRRAARASSCSGARCVQLGRLR